VTPARRIALVAIGGAYGGSLRLFATGLVPAAVDGSFAWSPIALLLVNLSGSLLAGFVRGLLEAREHGRELDGTRASGGRTPEMQTPEVQTPEVRTPEVRTSEVQTTETQNLSREGDRRDGLNAFLLVGFCGGFTSYSGFVAAAVAHAAWIAVATLVLCPLAALLGMRLSGGYPARPAGTAR
jgi:fluoride ion exporter CrcB/FEX